MTMMALLQELRQRGITVSSQGDSLKLQAPHGALTADLRARLAARKGELLGWLQERHHADDTALPVCVPDPESRYRPFPLSDMQLGFYMGDDPYMEFHVRPHYYSEKRVAGLDVARYEAAWNKALARHRGEIVTVRPDGQLQAVKDPAPLRCKVQDLRGAPAPEVERALEQVRAQMARCELPLDTWPWIDLRVSLWREQGADMATIHYNHNNFFSDGFGTTRLLQEIDSYYRSPALELSPLSLSFRDAALTLDAIAHSAAGQAARRYWEQRLDALPDAPALPQRASMERRCRSRLERREGTISSAVWSQFKARAAEAGVTPSNAVFCAYAEIISAWGNSRHFVLSNMMTRRLNIHPEMRDIIGNFASLYPLEFDFRQAASFTERARALQEQVIRDAAHLQWGGMQVMQALNRRKGSLGSAAIPFVIGSGLFMEGYERAHFSCLETSQVMLDHQFWELADGSYYYVWDLLEPFFPDGLIDSMWGAYQGLIERLAGDGTLWHATVFDLTPPAMLAARAAVCSPAQPIPPMLLQDFLGAAVRDLPAAQVLIAGERAWTYAELDQASDSIACALLDAADGGAPLRGKTVAIVADRGPALFQAVYAVLKAGGCYVPLDPALPEERRGYILADCGAAAILAQGAYAGLPGWPQGVPVLVIEAAAGTRAPAPAHAAWVDAAPAKPSDLAYLIYTSGSTGRPKGVMLEHGGVVNTVLDVNQRFKVGLADRVFGVSSFGFDLSVFDLFGTVAAGATLVYPDPAQALNPSHWLDVVLEQRVTLWNSAPPLAVLLIETAEKRGALLPDLRLVMLSGDWIAVDLPDRIRRIAPRARVVSLGGATEASIWSIAYEVGQVDPAWPSIPYGYPMRNQPWHVLDDCGRALPDWSAGELYIGGAGLARGYWNDSAKTAASFMPHPVTGERIYRTGDIGRYLPSGAIEFLGRRDAQVKIQGHRIELGEIEAVLCAEPGVGAAVAAVQAGAAGNAQLVAYVVPAAGAAVQVQAEALRAALEKKLPSYMVPRAIGTLERLPLSVNGKIDRKALPPMAEPAAAPLTRAARGPADATERRLLAIWRDILRRPELDAGDDFFDRGGQSFDAVRMIAAVREAFGVSLSLGAVWRERSVAGVAALLRAGAGAVQGHAGPMLTLREQGLRRTLFLVHPAGGHVMCYRALAGLLARPVHAFQAPGLDGQDSLPDSIEALAASHVALLEQQQPDGQVLLGGWSSGALIAFEMARQLRGRGRAVGGVVLIDCPAPLSGEPVDDKVLLGWFLEDLALGLPVAELLASVDAVQARAQLEQVSALLLQSGRPLAIDLEQLTAIYRVFGGIVRASRAYAGGSADVDMLLIRARDGVVGEFAALPHPARPDWGWASRTSGSVHIETLAGSHHTLLAGCCVAAVAERTERWLRRREKTCEGRAANLGGAVNMVGAGPERR
ncbi:amino acid adenylation domain-containing protein [Pseudoduganella sp. LjRoot289]|uniref:non-ribosomal peptide synthetase n=1 Tax=Pseudoduganella sp. LjRoot289 TaxID=3342314 RepID=UPI003ED10E57